MVHVAAGLAVNPCDGPYCDAVLDYVSGKLRVLEAECLHAGIVSAVQDSVNDGSVAESGSESVADEVAVALLAAGLRKPAVHVRKSSSEGLAECVEVTVIIDIYRYSELVLKEWSKSYSVTE